nr:hypothetical protein [Oceanococcus sp. HetDA_MAG_MS8]
MIGEETLTKLMRQSAERTIQARMIQVLLSSIGMRADSTELVMPLGADCSADNAAAVGEWLHSQEAGSKGASPATLRARLQRRLALWESDQWDT